MYYRQLNPDQFIVVHEGKQVSIKPCYKAMDALSIAFQEFLRLAGASDRAKDKKIGGEQCS